jgi:hypothetical protein
VTEEIDFIAVHTRVGNDYLAWVHTAQTLFAARDILARAPAAWGPSAKPGDAELLLSAVERLIELTREAIILQQRLNVLAKHPVYGAVALPLGQVAKPFMEAYNDFLRRLDEQLPTVDTTHRLDLQITMNPPPGVSEFSEAIEVYTSKFIDEATHTLRSGDVTKERFQIARGAQPLGEFSRIAIQDNLKNGLFVADDWYWSDDSRQWRPLSDMV